MGPDGLRDEKHNRNRDRKGEWSSHSLLVSGHTGQIPFEALLENQSQNPGWKRVGRKIEGPAQGPLLTIAPRRPGAQNMKEEIF